ncbi:hypothetical protein CC2G_014867 [Coprinopsis cinerea AmutBmut pab1-1]|nr:hypothetical protein CC2G_014867 [Coprinopsis cinerea AmutBmut pab1-1]
MPTLPEFDLSAAAQLSFKMARYCQQLMKREIDSSWKGFPSLPVADGLDLSLRMEGLQLVRVVDEAHSNPVRLDWKFDDYAPHLVQAQLSGADPRLASLAARFPAPKGEPYRTQPHCIIDHAGVIGWWYLPGCISESRQRTIYHSVQRLSHMPCTPIQTTSQGNWRDHPDRFGSGAVVDGLKAGVATFSVCWFQRGHAGAEDFPAPSATLKDPKNHQFIKDMTESFAVLGAVLAVTQPWLFDAGMEVLENLHTKCISVNNSKSSAIARPLFIVICRVPSGAMIWYIREVDIRMDDLKVQRWVDVSSTTLEPSWLVLATSYTMESHPSRETGSVLCRISEALCLRELPTIATPKPPQFINYKTFISSYL